MVHDNKNENKFSFLKFYFVPIGIGTILLSQNHKTSADGIPYKIDSLQKGENLFWCG